MQKQSEVQDALRRPQHIAKKLRLYVYNTHANQEASATSSGSQTDYLPADCCQADWQTLACHGASLKAGHQLCLELLCAAKASIPVALLVAYQHVNTDAAWHSIAMSG